MYTAKEEKLGGGAVEIGIRSADGALVAVITHPCAGADWFAHYASHYGRKRYRTRKAALAAFGLV